MSNNYIVLDTGMDGTGIPINLDFVARILLGADFAKTPTSTQKKTVYIFHGITGGASFSGSTTPCEFPSENLARAAFTRLINTLNTLNYLGQDMRQQSVNIDSIFPVTAVATTPTTITVSGNGFATGTITINEITVNSTFIDRNTISFVTDTTITAGTYNGEFVDL